MSKGGSKVDPVFHKNAWVLEGDFEAFSKLVFEHFARVSDDLRNSLRCLRLHLDRVWGREAQQFTFKEMGGKFGIWGGMLLSITFGLHSQN